MLTAQLAMAKVMYLQSIKASMEVEKKTCDSFFPSPSRGGAFFSLTMSKQNESYNWDVILNVEYVAWNTVDRYNERLLTISKITRLFCDLVHSSFAGLFLRSGFLWLSRFFLLPWYCPFWWLCVVCTKFQPSIDISTTSHLAVWDLVLTCTTHATNRPKKKKPAERKKRHSPKCK